MALRERKVIKAYQALTQSYRGRQDRKVILGHKVIRDNRVIQEVRVFRGQRGLRVQTVHKVYREQPQL